MAELAQRTGRKRRVGIAGAGLIAPHHLAALRRVPNAIVSGVYDVVPEKALALAVPAGLAVASSLETLCEVADVVHVLTPPDTHVAVASTALAHGCDVYVEKPLAVDVAGCLRLRAAALAADRQVNVGHSLLFDPRVRAILLAVESGAIGRVVSVDVLRSSVYPSFAGGEQPPQVRDPGFPFRDLGIHGLSLLEKLLGPIESMDATWESLGGDPTLAFDEWRALVRCERGLGNLQLSWNVRPIQSQVIVQGTRGVRRADLFLMSEASHRATPLPRALERAVHAVTESLEPLVQAPRNAARFLRAGGRAYEGLHELVRAFYESLDRGEPAPVGIDEAISPVRWSEHVARAARADHAARLASLPSTSAVDVLVTGASGGLGRATVEQLRREGHRVRVLVRRLPAEPRADLDWARGDLGDAAAVERAVRGARRVVHLGAAMRGDWLEHQRATVEGSAHVVEACLRHGVDKLVHVSSLSVLDWTAGGDGSVLSEETPLERRPEERGHYTRAKHAAEQIVTRAVRERGLRAVVLRPGQVFGGGLPLVTGAVARKVGGRWLVLGDARLPLPLVYVDDVVDAICLALGGPLEAGEVIHIVDPTPLTRVEVLARLAGHRVRTFSVPRSSLLVLGQLCEMTFAVAGRRSPANAHRFRAALTSHDFSSDRAERLLGWRPRVGVEEGIRRVVAASRVGDPASRPDPCSLRPESNSRLPTSLGGQPLESAGHE
jgi:nucleoside-diphosphate-sugar epimerase/predicted dehydrogenase